MALHYENMLTNTHLQCNVDRMLPNAISWNLHRANIEQFHIELQRCCGKCNDVWFQAFPSLWNYT